MCDVCTELDRKIGLYRRFFAEPVDQLTKERIKAGMDLIRLAEEIERAMRANTRRATADACCPGPRRPTTRSGSRACRPARMRSAPG
jgi:hypothetical protein